MINGVFAILQFFWFVSVSCLSGLPSSRRLLFVIASLEMLELSHRIASLLRIAVFLERFHDAGADGSISRRGVRERYQVMLNRQLIFSFSLFLNYPDGRNELTVVHSSFLCFLCVQARCAKTKC
jgi:hypothetical protein